VEHLWPILVQFVLRLIFGIAVAMFVTPPRLVTAGFYRVHLWVLMGLGTVTALAVYTNRVPPDFWPYVFWLSIILAVASYVGSVVWLYEKQKAGSVVIFIVALLALCGAALANPWKPTTTSLGASLAMLDLISSGFLLGVTMSAMFLGHWYLNTPTMELVPLKRLVFLMIGAIAIRTLLCAAGLGLHATSEPERLSWWLFVGLRWCSGLLGTLMMAYLALQTLKIPNTQSATGILYAGVILAFIGELTAQLLSVDALYPL
jgi:hypothetical protein